ncbi:sulfatase [Maribacter sp. HTCC2170]|uniref:sulfatase family protein n=1 Tax=Maribacter sp. (strain HTCC2170 / KCCM 42371) TaxID=313603 RepID=UPI00006BD468|nr:sulfatase [Maribacter sp. HTCC2170]EAR02283.1 probable sulfatase atsG [Maribacter sp. HTCC2170]
MRDFLNVWTNILLFILGFFCIQTIQSQGQDEKPNIVWLVTEDNSKHFLKLYDKDGASMPQIETLADKGIVFNNAFSNAPVCSVARSTIISGCYAPRVGSQYHRKMKLSPMPQGLRMFPEYLREVGYYTTNNSKEDYNFVKSGKVWDESSRGASYQNRKPDQPFFHVQNFGTTHEGQLHFSENQMQRNITKTSVQNVTVFPYHPNTAIYRYTNAIYHDLHQKADIQIGNFIKQLEDDNLMENTIIFYYGDHGGVLPRSKGYVYESGLNVPMLVYIPEKWKHLSPLQMGNRTDAFVEFIDLAPTILNLAGISVPEQMDGTPFLGKGVTQEDLNDMDTTFGYADRFDEKYDLVRSIRKGKYKYIRNYQPFIIDGLYNFYRYKMLAYKEWYELFQEGKLNEAQQQFFRPRAAEALYNIEKDPHEIHNLAANPANREILEDLRQDLQKQVKSMPDLSFYPEPHFIENGLLNPVDFGKRNKTEIAELITIADMSLKTFDDVKDRLRVTLESDNPWKKYWSLIVCSSFGEQASSFYKTAEKMIESEEENLVRIRAAEFLVLNNQKVTNDNLLEIVKNAKSETEANLILNSIALLKMVQPDFEIHITNSIFPTDWLAKDGDLVKRRIEFINSK